MSVTVKVPTPLRKFTAGSESVQGAGDTIGSLVENLDLKYPGLRERICDEQGAVRRFVNIFVSDEDIRFLQELATPLKDTDEVSIVPAIAGG